jgi:hypothetical protein
MSLFAFASAVAAARSVRTVRDVVAAARSVRDVRDVRDVVATARVGPIIPGPVVHEITNTVSKMINGVDDKTRCPVLMNMIDILREQICVIISLFEIDCCQKKPAWQIHVECCKATLYEMYSMFVSAAISEKRTKVIVLEKKIVSGIVAGDMATIVGICDDVERINMEVKKIVFNALKVIPPSYHFSIDAITNMTDATFARIDCLKKFPIVELLIKEHAKMKLGLAKTLAEKINCIMSLIFSIVEGISIFNAMEDSLSDDIQMIDKIIMEIEKVVEIGNVIEGHLVSMFLKFGRNFVFAEILTGKIRDIIVSNKEDDALVKKFKDVRKTMVEKMVDTKGQNSKQSLPDLLSEKFRNESCAKKILKSLYMDPFRRVKFPIFEIPQNSSFDDIID